MPGERPIAASGKPAYLREINERHVYETIRAQRPVTRAEVARRTHLSKPTVSLALRNLEGAGLVARAQGPASVRTRNGVLFEPVADAGLAVGVEIDRSSVRAALTDLDGRVIADCEIEHTGTSADRILDAVVAAVSRLTRGAARRGVLRSVVVGSPGVIDPDSGVLSHPGVLRALEGSRPAAFLGARLKVPVEVSNDVDLAALGEQARGHGRHCQHFAVISIGAGMGAALVLNGQLFLGARGGAGEIDDIPFRHVVPSTPPVSPALDGLVSVAASLAARHPESPLRPPYTPDAVYAAAADGDALGQAVIDQVATWVAWFAASVAAVVDPELIVLAGPIGAHEALAERVREHLPSLVPAPPEVLCSELGAASVLAGAVAVASQQALEAAFASRQSARRAADPPARDVPDLISRQRAAQ